MQSTQAPLKPAGAPSISMRPTPDLAPRRSAPAARGVSRARGPVVAALLLASVLVSTRARAAQPFIWDQDTNGIDDRVESVHLLGYTASFELGDTTLRQRIQVLRSGPDLLYGVYVLWNHEPTTSDYTSLALLGMPVLTRIERSEEHTSELQSPMYLVCRLLLEKKKKIQRRTTKINV